jgi:nicotinate-nucleotide pyrophosphorylase (carboxylating)
MARDPFPRRGPALDAAELEHDIRRFLREDVGSGDVTTASVVAPDTRASGMIVAREACTVAGIDIAGRVFAAVDPAIAYVAAVSDGSQVAAGAALASLDGPAAGILTGERLALNLLQRLSGIATVTRRYVAAIAGTAASVSDTRKTTPGLRALEKYAVHAGGGRNHRFGLYDAVLIKDNHLAAAGGMTPAIRGARAGLSPAMPVQVEVDTLEQLREALDLGVEAVLLDNMTPALVAQAVRLTRAHPRGGTCWLEASGGITLATIRAYAEAGVDTISVGALTHAAPSVDISLDLAGLQP